MADPPLNVHVHCAQCDAHVGICENEWVHLTASYARPKEKGINLGTRLGDRTQVVPHGPGQREADGCLMVELFCTQCSTTVGQSCKTAPEPEQQHLVNQRFFKLSRIYLKNGITSQREEPVFVDGENLDSFPRPTSVRSSAAPIQTLSRNGTAPAFRQSFPPPRSSQSHSFDPLPRQQNRMPPPPSQVPFQNSITAPFIHGSYLAGDMPPARNISRRMSDAPEPVRPTSSYEIQGLQREVSEQGTALSDCFNRLAAAESRLATDEKRVLETERRSIDMMGRLQNVGAPMAELGQRLQSIGSTCRERAIDCEKHKELAIKQEELLGRQAQQLDSLTALLKTLQDNMKEMKAQIEQFRSEPVVHESPRPQSHEFLDNLESMVRLMKDARAQDQQMHNLREENRAMKSRLTTIFTAMGSVSEENALLLENAQRDDNPLDRQTLGKRKRPDDAGSVLRRKTSHQATGVFETTGPIDPMLPTPDSTQVGRQSSSGSQVFPIAADDPVPDHTQDIAQEYDAGNGTLPLAPSTAQDDEAQDQQTNTAGQEMQLAQIVNEEEPVSDIRKARMPSEPPYPNETFAPFENSLQGKLVEETHPTLFPPHPRWQPRGPLRVPSCSPYPPQPSDASWHHHPALNHSSINSTRPSHNGQFTSPHATLPPSGRSILYPAPSHILRQQDIDPRLRVHKRDESQSDGTFSGALSRGHRLEDIVQRSFRPSSVAPSTQQRHHPPTADQSNDILARRSYVLQPRQASAVSSPAEAALPVKDRPLSYLVDSSQNAEAIDFSDEENTAPLVASPSRPREGAATAPSTTPVGEPHSALMDRATVQRTIRELTLEPLRRPVLEDQNQSKVSRRTSEISRGSVLPEFAAAINNLYSSAARHKAASSLRPANEKTGLTPQPDDTIMVSPHSEEEVSTSNIVHPQSNKPESPKHNQESEQSHAKDTSDIPLGNGPKPDDKPLVKSAGRGRPRKLARPSEVNTTVVSVGPENDDNCAVCQRTGKLLCCDSCPRSYHHRCLHPPMSAKQQIDGDWFCPQCVEQQVKQKAAETDDADARTTHDDSIIIVRRRLAEEAMAREMARAV